MLTRRQMIVSALTALAGGTWLKSHGRRPAMRTAAIVKARKNICPTPPW